jgi:hypothetical protein
VVCISARSVEFPSAFAASRGNGSALSYITDVHMLARNFHHKEISSLKAGNKTFLLKQYVHNWWKFKRHMRLERSVNCNYSRMCFMFVCVSQSHNLDDTCSYLSLNQRHRKQYQLLHLLI